MAWYVNLHCMLRPLRPTRSLVAAIGRTLGYQRGAAPATYSWMNE